MSVNSDTKIHTIARFFVENTAHFNILKGMGKKEANQFFEARAALGITGWATMEQAEEAVAKTIYGV